MQEVHRLSDQEFSLINNYIVNKCGISLSENKKYLIETRLSPLLFETNSRNFTEFYYKAEADDSGKLKDRIVDAMTTNETMWFRDTHPYTILEEVVLKKYAEELKNKKRSEIKVWSAACSTGQEPYSIAMTALEYERKNPGFNASKVKITASDISQSVLFIAMAGKYDKIAVTRGLRDELRNRYFKPVGNVWEIDDRVKRMVKYEKRNLQKSFQDLGKFDIIFCRNVIIYFSNSLKTDILERISEKMNRKAHLFLGGSESIVNYTNRFKMENYNGKLYYQLKE